MFSAGIGGRLQKASLYIFIGLLAYMPIHITASIWLGTTLNFLDTAKILKDIILVIGFSITIALSVNKAWFKELFKDKLVWLIIVFGLLNIGMAIVMPTDQEAEILGVVFNTRFLVFFLYGVLLTKLLPNIKVKKLAIKTAIAVGILVSFIGVLQYTILPDNTLTHIGYSQQNGVPPVFYIDNKPDFERVMSTIRDPNSLGSYLIIVITLMLSIYFTTKRSVTKQIMRGSLLLATMCLVFAFSRSALVGLIFSLAVFLILADTPIRRWAIKYRVRLGIGMASLLIVFTLLFIAVKNTYFVQNVVFHADKTTVLEDPNQLRVRFWQESVLGIVLQPQGIGPGTAGLASIKNKKQGTILNENYYLQIGTELGVLGLLLFITILFMVACRLYLERSSMLAIALLASFLGLALTNILVHIWANEAVAYTWWGLAGLYIVEVPSRPSLKHKHSKEQH